MIWGLEGRHTWLPPMPSDYPVRLSAAERVAGSFPLGLYEYILSLEPELYWPLNAEHGVTDQSGNGHDGTAQGGATIGASASLTGDPADSATNLDGSNDYVSSGYQIQESGVGAKRSLFAVVKRDTGSTDDQLVGHDGTDGMSVYFYPDSDPTRVDLQVRDGEGLNWSDASAPDVVTGSVMRLAITYDDTSRSIRLYVNGRRQAVENISALGFSASAGDLLLGTKDGASFFFDGKVAHFAVWERVLERQEIAALSAFAGAEPFTVPSSVVLNQRSDDNGRKLFPRYKVLTIGGLGGQGDSNDRRDARVAAQGERARRSFRRGKTVTYEGLTQARSRADLRDAEDQLRVAFDDQSSEGVMVVTPHPLYDDSGDYRYFPAKALALDIPDEVKYSPQRAHTLGHESAFVVSVRNGRSGGASYYDQDDVGHP